MASPKSIVQHTPGDYVFSGRHVYRVMAVHTSVFLEGKPHIRADLELVEGEERKQAVAARGKTTTKGK